ncbi:MAG TPA: UDP-N-acetylglucosamine 2-epimerase (non-hydrolyzing), partial [Terriglobales bacterium]|nr:UDP-N-acetylglucosamine 2-epimerase (non-hydrolyzing) [Terriglobales bacterium]
DAAQILLDREAINHPLPEGVPDDGSRIVLVTSHRRESWGAELENICGAILELAASYDDVRVIYPVHLNPNVRNTVNAMLRDHPRIHLTAPLDYFQFLSLLRRSYLVLTDSGGVQEEAPFFGKPTIVLRKVTERPEAAMLGLSKIVGTAREAIVYEAGRLLSDPETYRRMAQGGNPYGDGRAAERIGAALSRWYSGNSPWLEVWEEFAGAAPAEVAAA